MFMGGAVVEVEAFGDYGSSTGAITLPNLSLTTSMLCGVARGVRRCVGRGVRRCVGRDVRRFVGTTLARVMDMSRSRLVGMDRGSVVGRGRGRIVGISGRCVASFRKGHCS